MMTGKIEAIREIDIFTAGGFRAGIVEKNSWKIQRELYEAISRAFPDERFTIVTPRQTHSADILFIDSSSSAKNPVADGLMSRSSDICLTLRTADCVPILFADISTGLFGAVHAGWRGLTAGIIEEMFALARTRRSFPENMMIFLGPSIGRCCFKIGDEVAALFDDDYVVNREGQNYADLGGAIRNKILGYGVNESNIQVWDDCTCCENERFYSYRRNGEAPIQMISYIFKTSLVN